MATRYFDIEKALLDGLRVVDAVTPMETPNSPISSKPEGLWLKVYNGRTGTVPITLGVNGEDEHRGFYK